MSGARAYFGFNNLRYQADKLAEWSGVPTAPGSYRSVNAIHHSYTSAQLQWEYGARAPNLELR